MGNMAIGFPNWVAGSTEGTPAIVSAGSWESTMPASNVLDRFLSKRARSTDSSTSSTKIRIDLGATRNVQIVAVCGANLRTSATITASGYSDAGFSTLVVTTGEQDAWPDVYEWGSRPWGSPDLFSPKFSSEDAAGYPFGWYYIFPSVEIARYWEIEFDDSASGGDGYVEVGRIVLAPLWETSINPQPGASIEWQSASQVIRGRTGVRFVDARTPNRVSRYSIDYLPEGEAFANPFDMARRANLDGEVFVVHDTEDAANSIRRGYLANLRVLPSITYPVPIDRVGVNIEVEEVMG